MSDFFEMGLLCISLIDLSSRFNTPSCFSLPDSSSCVAQVPEQDVFIFRDFCLFSKQFLSFFGCQKIFSALKNYTMTTWQGLIFWNNSCTSLADVCRSQHLEAASNTSCANSHGQEDLIQIVPKNGFTGATVSLEVIWRNVLGEKTSPSAEYYARHVLGQWGLVLYYL